MQSTEEAEEDFMATHCDNSELINVAMEANTAKIHLEKLLYMKMSHSNSREQAPGTEIRTSITIVVGIALGILATVAAGWASSGIHYLLEDPLTIQPLRVAEAYFPQQKQFLKHEQQTKEMQRQMANLLQQEKKLEKQISLLQANMFSKPPRVNSKQAPVIDSKHQDATADYEEILKVESDMESEDTLEVDTEVQPEALPEMPELSDESKRWTPPAATPDPEEVVAPPVVSTPPPTSSPTADPTAPLPVCSLAGMLLALTLNPKLNAAMTIT